MCKIRSAEECKKRVFIETKTGEVKKSEWFTDNGEKSEVTNATRSERDTYLKLLKEFDLTEQDIIKWSVNRLKEQEYIYISDHAFRRLRERNGWNKRTAFRMVKRVYDNGKRTKDIKGQIKTYIKKREKSHPDDEYVVYGNDLYIFCKHMLVTVFPLRKFAEEADEDLELRCYCA